MRLFIRWRRDREPVDPKEMVELRKRLSVLEKRLDAIRMRRRWGNGDPRKHA
jgi:hypothetical protein